MSVAGFGDYDIGQICVPSMTTINPFPIEIGQQAARVILDLLEGKPTDRILTIVPELLVRESTQLTPSHRV
ncbi:DNA-binding transcriptional regulator CytR [compost metagenome]